MNNSKTKNLKSFLIITFLLIVMNALFGCNKSESTNVKNETIVENSNYNFNEAIKSAKCVNEYPDTAIVDDFDTVKFGKYEQDGDESNGKEDIEWIVLKKDEENDNITLMSKYILDYKLYLNDRFFDFRNDCANWEKSDIRKYLNNEFFKLSFDKNEKKLIEDNKTQYIYFQNVKKTEGSCSDKVFLLDENEIKIYFKNKEKRVTVPTINALYNFEIIDGSPLKCISNGKLDMDLLNKSGWLKKYYLRNFYNDENAYCVDEQGNIIDVASYFQDDIAGLRPVITIKCKLTKEDSKINLNSRINNIKPVCEYKLSDIYTNDTLKNNDAFDTVKFGNYNIKNVEKTPVEWLVIEKKEDRALLLSKNIIDARYFNEGRNFEYWGKSNVREWLNTELYNTIFSDEEKNLVLKSEVKNGINQYNGIESGNHTSDYMFLLNYDEVRKYFSQFADGEHNNYLSAKSTDYVKSKYDSNETSFNDDSFLLRDVINDEKSKVLYVDSDGDILNTMATKRKCGIRPAIWVKFENSEVRISNQKENNIDINADSEKELINNDGIEKNYNIDYFSENKLDFTFDVDPNIVIVTFVKNSKYGDSILSKEFESKYCDNDNVKLAKIIKENLIVAIQDKKDKNKDKIIIFDDELNVLKEYPKYCYFVTDDKGRIFIKSRIYNEDVYVIDEYDNNLWYDERLSGFNIIDSDLSLMFKFPVNNILCKYVDNNGTIDMNELLIKDTFQSYIFNLEVKKVEKVLNDIGFKELRLNEPNLHIVEEMEYYGRVFYNTVGEFDNYILYSFKDLNEERILLRHNKNVRFATTYVFYEGSVILKCKEKNENDIVYNNYYNIKLEYLGTDNYDQPKEILQNGKIYNYFIPLEHGYYIYKYDVLENEKKIKVYLKHGTDECEVKIEYGELYTVEEFSKKFKCKIYGMKECLLFNRENFYNTTFDYYDFYDIKSNIKLFDNIYKNEIYVEETGDNLPYNEGLLIFMSRKKEIEATKHHSELIFVNYDLHEIKERMSFISEVKLIGKKKINSKILLILNSGRHNYLLNLNSLLFYKYREKINFTDIDFGENAIHLEYNGNEKIKIDENFNIIK